MTFVDVVTITDGQLMRIEAYVDRDSALRAVAADLGSYGGERLIPIENAGSAAPEN